MSQIQVVLADDHPVIRSHLKRILQRDSDIVVIGEASDGLQTMEIVRDLDPDVVILDVEMPGLNGIEATHKLREEGFSASILIITSHNDAHMIFPLFKLGVDGFVVKDEALKQVVPAVRAVADGKTGWVSDEVSKTLPEPVKEELIELDEKVTRRFSRNLFRDTVGVYVVEH
jgi:two-component system, NarL family, response regulator DegU